MVGLLKYFIKIFQFSCTIYIYPRGGKRQMYFLAFFGFEKRSQKAEANSHIVQCKSAVITLYNRNLQIFELLLQCSPG